MSTKTVTLWKPAEVVAVPKEKKTTEELVAYATQLSPREVAQIVQAFGGGSYEMGSSFVWQKTMAGLKRKLGDLGMDFVAEMLDRQDVSPGSNPTQVLTDYDALRLADELGFFPPTHALRLRHSMEIIAHFADREGDADDSEDDGMNPEEAMQTLRVCIQTVLGHPQFSTAVEFANFRRDLENRSFKADDAEIVGLSSSPYFFRKTALRVLLASIKTAEGAQLQHAVSNLNVMLPAIWEDLLKPDRHLVGWSYAELHAAGRQKATLGVQRALLAVQGFDYVPESLRSRSYLQAAQRVLDAHFGWNNFHNEGTPMQVLKSLGTSIPGPAFAKCLSAILCVKLGNQYGVAWSAESKADEMLVQLTPEQWAFYFDECLPADDNILSKLVYDSLALRFAKLVQKLELHSTPVTKKTLVRLLQYSQAGNAAGVSAEAKTIMALLRKGKVVV